MRKSNKRLSRSIGMRRTRRKRLSPPKFRNRSNRREKIYKKYDQRAGSGINPNLAGKGKEEANDDVNEKDCTTETENANQLNIQLQAENQSLLTEIASWYSIMGKFTEMDFSSTNENIQGGGSNSPKIIYDSNRLPNFVIKHQTIIISIYVKVKNPAPQSDISGNVNVKFNEDEFETKPFKYTDIKILKDKDEDGNESGTLELTIDKDQDIKKVRIVSNEIKGLEKEVELEMRTVGSLANEVAKRAKSQGAKSKEANVKGAKSQGANVEEANVEGGQSQVAKEAKGANVEGGQSQVAKEAKGANVEVAQSQVANVEGARVEGAQSQVAKEAKGARVEGANDRNIQIQQIRQGQNN